ncbi:formylglycine-generating enzyme family protein [bacterium]|nr:formylglycine-generating enzyme family protein [bacterium]
MKIIYGDSLEQLTADALRVFMEADTCSSGDLTYAIGDKDGVLDSDSGELKAYLDILAGARARDVSTATKTSTTTPVVTAQQQPTPSKAAPTNSTTTPNGRTYSDGIVTIPGGQFSMGSVYGSFDERKDSSLLSNGTSVTVTMTGFMLAKSEVTVGQYKAYLAAIGDTQYSRLPNLPENQKGDKFPVVGLTYNEMMFFCQYYGGKLPTAAQIEYASKGPNHTDVYGTPFNKMVSYNNGYRTTAEVCGTNDERANGFGVCDLAGNVWETTRDQYDVNFYDWMAKTDPSNPITDINSQWIEIRSGSWFNVDWYNRAANRYFDRNPDNRSNYVGFRVAWPLPQGSNK